MSTINSRSFLLYYIQSHYSNVGDTYSSVRALAHKSSFSYGESIFTGGHDSSRAIISNYTVQLLEEKNSAFNGRAKRRDGRVMTERRTDR